MNPLEQAALAFVLLLTTSLGLLAKWALRQKTVAEERASEEAMKRMEMEVRHDVENKSIDQLVSESNKRHGRS